MSSDMPDVEYIQLKGQELRPYLKPVAELRMTVFREFPYLYEGTFEYEKNYFEAYLQSQKSLVIVALVDGEVVGASTCLPMSDESKEFQKPFLDLDTGLGADISEVFYFGESIILKEFRGRKIGHHFFKLREQHAAEVMSPLKCTTFCAVNRGVDHPLRPSGYRPLDEFWKRMGYKKKENMKVYYKWKDVDESGETQKSLTCWVKIWNQ